LFVGYGIVRPKLLNIEWGFVIILGIGYLISAIIGEVSEIILFKNNVKASTIQR
jgi:hypothetical protein